MYVMLSTGNPDPSGECGLKTWSKQELTEQTTGRTWDTVMIQCDASCVGEGYPPALKWFGPNNKRIPEVPGR
jgi:hypothetical protein